MYKTIIYITYTVFLFNIQNISGQEKLDTLTVAKPLPTKETTDELNESEYNSLRDKRTFWTIYLAFGLNHGLIDGVSFSDTPYQIGGSKFFEAGFLLKTQLLKDSYAVRIVYGVSYQSNGIKTTDNLYFVKDENLTTLETYEGKVHKAKLRMDNFVVPVFFEFGPSKKVQLKDYFKYYTLRKIIGGLGGYAGVNVSTRQKLRATNLEGEKSKDVLKDDYNTNKFIYGIAAYLGYGKTTLYVKYDLNEMFKEPNVAQHNISLGLRLEL